MLNCSNRSYHKNITVLHCSLEHCSFAWFSAHVKGPCISKLRQGLQVFNAAANVVPHDYLRGLKA